MAASIQASKVIQFYTGVLDNTGVTVVVAYEIVNLDPALDPFGQSLLVPNMPVRGDGLAGFTGVVAQRFEFKPFKNSRTKGWILVTYRPPEYFAIGEAVATFDATTKIARRHYDGDGNPIKLQIKNPTTDLDMEPANIQAVDTVACGILTADWTTFNKDDAAALIPYDNTVNVDVFRGCSRWTWWFKCARVTKAKFHSEYNIHVEMEYDPEGWLQTYFWRDNNGNIPFWIDPTKARDKGPGIYKDLYFVRGTLKRGRAFASLPAMIPEFDNVVPDLTATRFLTLNDRHDEEPYIDGTPWI